MKIWLTWTEKRLLKLWARQNLHFKAEMLGFLSEYFLYRKLRRAPENLSFRFMCPDTGTVRILDNILYVLDVLEKDE